MATYPRWQGELPIAIASFSSSGRAKKSRIASIIVALTCGSTPWPVIRKKPVSRQIRSISAAVASCSGLGGTPVAKELTSTVGRLSVTVFPSGVR